MRAAKIFPPFAARWRRRGSDGGKKRKKCRRAESVIKLVNKKESESEVRRDETETFSLAVVSEAALDFVKKEDAAPPRKKL